MRVLVSWGSTRGGTEGIARTVAEELRRAGIDVDLKPASGIGAVEGYDAAVLGGALYANRWHRDACRLATRNIAALRRIPVWLFSSGPLDDSADRGQIPPPRQVSALVQRLGALGHETFGGRLLPDSKGFPAAAMARTSSGDWRNPERIKAWAADLAHALPSARPGVAIDPPGRSVGRLLGHGLAGWALCAVLMAALLQFASAGLAIAVHAIAAPLIFAAVSVHYFGELGAREPFPTAIVFTLVVVLLDALVVAGLILHSFAMFASFAGTWLPFILIFAATLATGTAISMMPMRLSGMSSRTPPVTAAR